MSCHSQAALPSRHDGCSSGQSQAETIMEKRLNLAASSMNMNQSPVTSPYKMSPKNAESPNAKCADRLIPMRSKARWHLDFNVNPDTLAQQAVKRQRSAAKESPDCKDGVLFSCLLHNELLGTQIDNIKDIENVKPEETLTSSNRLFHFNTANNTLLSSESGASTRRAHSSQTSLFLGTPVSESSEKLLMSPRKPQRRISKIPFKVLDAPELQDDFYLNLVDWSSQNILGVGLGSCLYLWSASSSQVTKLCDLSEEHDSVTAVCWDDKGKHVAVGTNRGIVQLWDITTSQKVADYAGHTARIGTVAWHGDSLCSGSRDRRILLRNIKSPSEPSKLEGHGQEVCGLKWSPDGRFIASGGNDNKLCVWSPLSTRPVQTYTDHIAAVKAIAWSPHQHGLLASGGGTADRHIRFWNITTGQPLPAHDTGSQVCNLIWSKHSSELVSTHGYSQNQILMWKYPSLHQVAKLTGHNSRVLYLARNLFGFMLFQAMSPDGESIVTGAGDETLRFWNLFSKVCSPRQPKSFHNLATNIR